MQGFLRGMESAFCRDCHEEKKRHFCVKLHLHACQSAPGEREEIALKGNKREVAYRVHQGCVTTQTFHYVLYYTKDALLPQKVQRVTRRIPFIVCVANSTF